MNVHVRARARVCPTTAYLNTYYRDMKDLLLYTK